MLGDLGQIYQSRTAKGFFRIGRNSMKLTERTAYFDRYYENIEYFGLPASVSSTLN